MTAAYILRLLHGTFLCFPRYTAAACVGCWTFPHYCRVRFGLYYRFPFDALCCYVPLYYVVTALRSYFRSVLRLHAFGYTQRTYVYVLYLLPALRLPSRFTAVLLRLLPGSPRS